MRNVLALLLAVPALADPPSAARMRADVRFLASDLLEGRAAGTPGGQLAVEYLAAQFRQAGLDVALQSVPLVGVETKPESRVGEFRWLVDFAGNSPAQAEEVRFDGEVVFVGHGITAAEFGWDDYRGADVRGKVVVLFTNEPPSPDPRFFGGPALTYYGRWTYKFEEAARRGAAAALIVHTPESAGYDWNVVRSSWGREDAQVRSAAPENELRFAGWLTAEAGTRLLGRSAAELLALADKPGFRAMPLGKRLGGVVRSRVRSIETANVVAKAAGGDAKLGEEAVVFSAHWDHLGRAAAGADSIHNGAVDNATGCAVLLEMARLWSRLEPRPKRTAIFLATAAEEAGLRGAEYYAANPAIPLQRTAVDLNFDSILPFGRTRDVILSGAERTTLWPDIQHIANRYSLVLAPDPRPEQGSFFRSDHFAFARRGVAAFSVKLGTDFTANREENLAQLTEYNAKRYHQPSDEFRDDWDFAGLEQAATLGLEIGFVAANAPARATIVPDRTSRPGTPGTSRPPSPRPK